MTTTSCRRRSITSSHNTMPLACHIVTLTTLCLLMTANASQDFNGGGAPSQFTVNQHLSVDPASDSVFTEADVESFSIYSDAEEETHSEGISSSLLYEGGCYVSSQAIMCHGGDMFDFAPSHMMESEFEEDSDDDDEDDDDDDDGHSSMLSNASLSRSRVSVGGSKDDGSSSRQTNKPSSSTTFKATEPAFALGNSAALSLRGGATAAVGSEFAQKLLVAAIVTLAYELVLGHLLEFVKILMQTSPPGTTYGDVLKSITAEKGIVGIWDGFVPWGVVQSIFKGGVFGLAHAIAMQLLVPLADDGKLPKQLALTLAGGIAGGFQGYVLSPTLLLKTRVMTKDVFREKMSLLRTTLLSFRLGADVVAQEGLGALMKGANIFATKRVFDWATRYFFADMFEAMLKDKKGTPLTAGDKIAASLAGGTLSTLSTLPLDVLVAKTQDAKKAGESVSAIQLFRNELTEVGWSGLRDSYTRGFVVRLMHVCFTTVVMKTGSPIVYDFMFGKTSS